MKKILPILAIISVLIFIACEGPQGPPGPPGYPFEAEVFELKNVNFDLDPNNGFTIYQKLRPKIEPGDVLLIYRLAGTIDPVTPIWQLIPKTLFLTDSGNNPQELDYDYDFSREDFTIYAGGTFDLDSSLGLPYINNQTFRIMIVPGAISKNIDVSDYNTVINLLNINPDSVQLIDTGK